MTSRPRFRRASILTALVGVLAATLVAGPATATNSGHHKADQGLAFYTPSTSVGGDGYLYVGASGRVDVTVTAIDGGTNVQQPIDKALIEFPGSFNVDSASTPNGSGWSVTQIGASSVLVEADKMTGGREGLWPGDSITVTIHVTPSKYGTFSIGVSAAVQHDVTDPKDHAVQVGDDPTVTVGIQASCAPGTTCTGSIGGFTIKGNSDGTTNDTLKAHLSSSGMWCQSDASAPVVDLNILTAAGADSQRSKQISQPDVPAGTNACFGSPNPFYAVDSSGNISAAGTHNGEYEGSLPTCSALVAFLSPSGGHHHHGSDLDNDGDDDDDVSASAGYPCVDSTVTDHLVVLAPGGDPRFTN
jgi:hypothetical protein